MRIDDGTVALEVIIFAVVWWFFGIWMALAATAVLFVCALFA